MSQAVSAWMTYRQIQLSVSDFECTCQHRWQSYCYFPPTGPWNRLQDQVARFAPALGVTCMPDTPLGHLGILKVPHDLLEVLDGALVPQVAFARSFSWTGVDRAHQLALVVSPGFLKGERPNEGT